MSKICFIANLFPSKKDPSFGSFVGKIINSFKHRESYCSKVVIDYRASGFAKLICYIKFIASGMYAISSGIMTSFTFII